MKLTSLESFCHTVSDFQILDILPELWTKRNSFALYWNNPRPCSALFYICTDINASFTTRMGNTVTVGQGDLLWIPSGSQYRAEVTGSTQKQIATYTLNIKFMDKSKKELLISDNLCVIGHDNGEEAQSRIQIINDEIRRKDWNEKNITNNLKIKANFYTILNELISPDNNDSILNPIREGIEQLKKEWNLNEPMEKYASICEISLPYFYRCFREITEHSPVEFRNQIRISNAKSMLRNTGMKISEISESVGFDDPFYFCRIFKKKNAVSPKKYRQIWSNNKILVL